MYSDEDLKKWRRAASIAAEVLEYGKGLIKKGALILEVSDKIDQRIHDCGALPAWPCQLSLDSTAAHDCADPDDKRVFGENVVKLDVGVRIDGFVGDNATTVDLSGKYDNLVKASRDALDRVAKIVRVGVTLHEIGKTIQDTITSYGYCPIKNLSGHTISPFIIHDSPTIPNIATGDKTTLVQGQVIAIEPFATTGAGIIYESERSNLFALVQKKPIRSPFAREVLQFIDQQYRVFPFTTRWLTREFGVGKTNLALRELLRAGMLRQHPPLIEKAKGIVTQAEHTFLIDDTVECLTK